jgi:hypothetical protein
VTDTHVDMRLDKHVDAKPVTSLESLAGELRAVQRGTVTIKADERSKSTKAEWAVRFSLALDGPRLAGWQKAAEDDITGDVDYYLWQRTILAAQCIAILHNGEVVMESGGPIDFRSRALQEMLGMPPGLLEDLNSVECVRRFYGNDFNISGTAARILDEAGFGKEAKTVDPTPGTLSF